MIRPQQTGNLLCLFLRERQLPEVFSGRLPLAHRLLQVGLQGLNGIARWRRFNRTTQRRANTTKDPSAHALLQPLDLDVSEMNRRGVILQADESLGAFQAGDVLCLRRQLF